MSKIVKTKTTTYDILQAKANLFTFNENFRNMRRNYKYQGFSCYNCNRNFKDGEKFGLIITNKGNKTVCNSCADKFSKELEKTGENS